MTVSSKSRGHSRFIPKEEVGVVAEWQFNAMGAPLRTVVLLPDSPPEPEPEPEETVQIRIDRAWDEGYGAGLEQGRTEATNEGNHRLDAFVQGQGAETAEKLAELLSAMQARLAQAEQDIAQQVLALACGVARQIVRRELSVDPVALLSVVREALGMLVMDGKTAVVKLHPLDWEVLQEPLQQAFPSPTITWLSDAAVERGGCLVESGGTVIDGTLSKRWERAVAHLGLASTWTDASDGA